MKPKLGFECLNNPSTGQHVNNGAQSTRSMSDSCRQLVKYKRTSFPEPVFAIHPTQHLFQQAINMSTYPTFYWTMCGISVVQWVGFIVYERMQRGSFKAMNNPFDILLLVSAITQTIMMVQSALESVWIFTDIHSFWISVSIFEVVNLTNTISTILYVTIRSRGVFSTTTWKVAYGLTVFMIVVGVTNCILANLAIWTNVVSAPLFLGSLDLQISLIPQVVIDLFMITFFTKHVWSARRMLSGRSMDQQTTIAIFSVIVCLLDVIGFSITATTTSPLTDPHMLVVLVLYFLMTTNLMLMKIALDRKVVLISSENTKRQSKTFDGAKSVATTPITPQVKASAPMDV
jgi:hypothetical protein